MVIKKRFFKYLMAIGLTSFGLMSVDRGLAADATVPCPSASVVADYLSELDASVKVFGDSSNFSTDANQASNDFNTYFTVSPYDGRAIFDKLVYVRAKLKIAQAKKCTAANISKDAKLLERVNAVKGWTLNRIKVEVKKWKTMRSTVLPYMTDLANFLVSFNSTP